MDLEIVLVVIFVLGLGAVIGGGVARYRWTRQICDELLNAYHAPKIVGGYQPHGPRVDPVAPPPRKP